MGNFLESGGNQHSQADLGLDRKPGSVATMEFDGKRAKYKSAPVSESDSASKLADAIRSIAAGVTPAELNAIREDLAHVAARVETLESAKPTTIQFKIGESLGKVIQGARPEVSSIVRRVACGFGNIWLTGPAGSGKTTLARQIADALGRRFAHQSFAPDITTGALLGGINVEGKWQETAFVDFYENGGVYLLDEVDAADASILLAMNAALENGHLSLPRHHDPARRTIKRHADTVIIAAGNTWGTGADAMYIGRAQLDAAFLRRFAGAKFAINYDRQLEESILSDRALLTTLWGIRDKLSAMRVRRLMGTGEVVAAAKLRAGGFKQSEIIDALTVDWTSEEKAKVL